MQSLFIEELDGETYATEEEAEDAYYRRHGDTCGPVWSDYGGWVN
jgi:hypothetical protein